MTRFKIARKNNQEQKQLLQAKLDASLVEEVNLLCKWSGNEKNFVIAELLRFALSQETDFQQYRQSLAQTTSIPSAPAMQVESAKKVAGAERKTAAPTAMAG